MGKPSRYLYEFGPFRLDTTNRFLLRNGEPVSLTPKVFDTLLALVEQSGRVVSKSDLMERIWPSTTVEENNLTQNISALRKVLGQTPDGRQYIETIPRRGYRFASGTVDVWEEEEDLVLEKHTRARIVIEEEQEERKVYAEEARTARFPAASRSLLRLLKKKKIMLAAAVLLAITVIAGVVWKLQPSRPVEESPVITPIANWKPKPLEPTDRNGAFSPDGKLIAFSSNRTGKNNIWIRQTSGGDPVQVTKDESGNESPVWSPDGQQIAFLSIRGGRTGIWVIPALGGNPALLKMFGSDWPELCLWSKDGSRIYYEVQPNLFALDVATKEVTQITDFDPSKPFPSNFSLSPDETRIAYVDSQNESTDIWVASLHADKPRRVTDDPATEVLPVWLPDGSGLAYSSDRSGTYQLYVAYLDGRERRQITIAGNHCFVSDVAPDGTRILYNVSKEESDIFQIDIDSGQISEVVSVAWPSVWPDISPDGRSIAFQETNGMTKWMSSLIMIGSMENPGQWRQLAAEGFDPLWSPDGSRLSFYRFSNMIYNIITVDASSGDEKQLTEGGVSPTGFTTMPYNRKPGKQYSWSPDSSRIVYGSDKSGQSNLWVISADGSGDTMVTNNVDYNFKMLTPAWSPDSKLIAFTSIPRTAPPNVKRIGKLWVMEADRFQPRTVFQSDTIFRLIGWFPSSNDVLIALIKSSTAFSPSMGQVDLVAVSAYDGSKREIARVPSAYFYNIQLSPDGQNIALVARQDEKDNVWMIPASGGKARKLTQNAHPSIFYSGLVWSPDGKKIVYSEQSNRNEIVMISKFN